jgi:hypothetical protein
VRQRERERERQRERERERERERQREAHLELPSVKDVTGESVLVVRDVADWRMQVARHLDLMVLDSRE